jgi:hypothetical protein
MSVKLISSATNTIQLKKCHVGQLVRVVDPDLQVYTNHILLIIGGHEYSKDAVSLTDPKLHWSGIASRELQVEVLPAGTKVEFTSEV